MAGTNATPRLGYVYPPGAAGGRAVDVFLGGYDWTPDMQIFADDPRVRVEVLGPPGKIIEPSPPYWFGPKSFLPALPMPREMPVRLHIPTDIQESEFRLQAANANGATGALRFRIGRNEEVVEEDASVAPQHVSALPVTVSGRLAKIAEVDRYRFVAQQTGPVTCEVLDRLGQPFNAVLLVSDIHGHRLCDCVDSAGRGASICFAATMGQAYDISVHDLDFRGDRGFVYRLSIMQGPQLLAAPPPAGQRGKTSRVEFFGRGIATGRAELESLTNDVVFPDATSSFAHSIDTAFGRSTSLPLLGSDLAESITCQLALESGGSRIAPSPCGVSGLLQNGRPDRFQCTWTKGASWHVSVECQAIGSLVDPYIRLIDENDTEVVRSDVVSSPGDAGLTFDVPADGVYCIEVGDINTTQAAGPRIYRLSVRNPQEAAGFDCQVLDHLDIPLGGQAELSIKLVRRTKCKFPVQVALEGSPPGVSVQHSGTIGAEESELKITLSADANEAATSTLAHVSCNARIGDSTLAQRKTVLLATTMVPRCKIEPLEPDGGRTVHRGTTFPAQIMVERVDGYDGEITLQQAAQQERHRQGITGPEMIVPAGLERIAYPIFLPEWLETSRTSRMVLIGVAKVPDARGNIRHVTAAMRGASRCRSRERF